MKNESGSENFNEYKMSFGLENQNEKGSIKLHEGVIASVVKNAVVSIKGVVRLGGSVSLTDSIAYMIGTRKSSDGAIQIKILEDDKVDIQLRVVVAYGENIPSLALNIQMTIIEKVKAITGMDVARVDVVVQGIEDLKQPEKEESEE